LAVFIAFNIIIYF